jgi:hypothetical protein
MSDLAIYGQAILTVRITAITDKGLEGVRRSLTHHERALIVWLIEHGTYNNKARFRSQVDSLSVRERGHVMPHGIFCPERRTTAPARRRPPTVLGLRPCRALWNA